MAWVVFASAIAFNNYHQAACAANNIPRPGYREDNNVVQILAQWTTSWAQPVYAGPNVFSPIKCVVPDADVVTYGLTTTTDPTLGTVTQYPSTALAKPLTYFDPVSGLTYNTQTGLPI